jgi:hypothetical protein
LGATYRGYLKNIIIEKTGQRMQKQGTIKGLFIMTYVPGFFKITGGLKRHIMQKTFPIKKILVDF